MKAAVFAAVVCVWHAAAHAQSEPKWEDIDCTKSRIDVPAGAGLRCRATSQFAAENTGGSGFRRFNAYAPADGRGTFYILTEALFEGSVGVGRLADEIRLLPAGKDAYDIGGNATYRDVNYLRFKARTGEQCIGARKFGPARSAGYRWVIYGGHCQSNLTPQQEMTFMDTMKVR